MDKITWKYVKPLNDKSMVNSFLQKNGIRLPEELVKCMTENNGGRPSTYLFKTIKGKEYVFQSLFSYNLEDKNSVYNIFSSMFENSIYYPIGIEAAGNIICYHQNKGKYALWNHETDEFEDIILNDM